MADVFTLVGRILIAALFLAGFAQKTSNPAAVETLLAAHGWPLWLIWPATVFNLAAAAALILGLWTRPVAGQMLAGNASAYVDLSLAAPRYSSRRWTIS